MRSRSLVIFSSATMSRISSSENEPRRSRRMARLAWRANGRAAVKNRNRKMELRALADLAFYPNPAAVSFDKMLGDGEPQPGAPDFAGTCDIHAVKALEDSRLICLRDADAGIRNRNGHFGAIRRGPDHDLAPSRSVLHGVVQQVLQNFSETAAVGHSYAQRLLQIHGDAQIFFGGSALRGLDAALDELSDAEPANLQFQLVGIHFRKLEQIVGEPGEAPRMFENDLEEAQAVLRVVDRPA